MGLQLQLCRSNEAGQPYYVLIRSAGNWEILFWSENYSSRQNAINAGQILLDNGLKAKFVDKTLAA